MKYCKECGKLIAAKSHNKYEKLYCSRACRFKQYGGEKVYTITMCQWCGKPFRERNGVNNYCSRSCSAKAENAVKLLYGESKFREEEKEHKEELREELRKVINKAQEIITRIEREKKCVVCGSWFVARNSIQICCSIECSKKRDNAQHDHRNERNGAADKSITLTSLYMRDGGMCWICGRHIDFDCDPNSNDYPSIDHIQPLSKGGRHSWNNVRLACRGCNSKRGNRTE